MLAFSTSCLAINIAIFDTGFCPKKIKNLPKNIKIYSPIDLTNSVSINCKKNIAEGRLHGQKVLETFIHGLKTKTPISITPYIVFDKNKSQNLKYWKKAFNNKNQTKFDLYLIAAGFPYAKADIDITLNKELVIFVSQGKSGRGITKKHKLWPQEKYQEHKNLFIIGAHYPMTKYDKGYPDSRAKYLKEAHYYFPDRGENIHFIGSSYSVAIAAAKAINKCQNSFNKLRSCLKKNSKELDWDYPLKARTF